MVLVVDLTLSDDLLLFGETFEQAPAARLLINEYHYAANGEGGIYYVFFMYLRGSSPGVLDEALATDPSVSDFRQVINDDGRTMYRITTTAIPPDQPLVFPLFREYDVVTKRAVRDAEGFHLRGQFPDRDAVQAFLDAGQELAGSVEVTRMYSLESTSPNGVLTEKQRDALQLAAEHGYFETPSKVTLAELAEKADVTPQTLSTHIRAGVRKLVDEALTTNSN